MYFKEIVLAKIINSHLTFLKPTKSIKYIFNLNIQEDIKNSVFDKINELSEKSRLLLEKGPAYQNDIKSVYVAGCSRKNTWKNILLLCAVCSKYKHLQLAYKFNDVEEKKIRNCRIYLPFKHFLKSGFILKTIHLLVAHYILLV